LDSLIAMASRAWAAMRRRSVRSMASMRGRHEGHAGRGVVVWPVGQGVEGAMATFGTDRSERSMARRSGAWSDGSSPRSGRGRLAGGASPPDGKFEGEEAPEGRRSGSEEDAEFGIGGIGEGARPVALSPSTTADLRPLPLRGAAGEESEDPPLLRGLWGLQSRAISRRARSLMWGLSVVRARSMRPWRPCIKKASRMVSTSGKGVSSTHG